MKLSRVVVAPNWSIMRGATRAERLIYLGYWLEVFAVASLGAVRLGAWWLLPMGLIVLIWAAAP